MIDDAALAAHLATTAGGILLALQRSDTLAGSRLGDEGDRLANACLMDALRRERPADAILSEEEADDRTRCTAARVWIIDPLDGTREYGEGRADWAVHVALAVDGIVSIGAVALPARGLTLDSGTIRPVAAPPQTPLRMVVSRSRPPAQALHVAAACGATLMPMGSAGAKAMAVVLGEADIYLHAVGQHEWDNAAPVAVAMAAGLHCSRLDGAPLRYNGADTLVEDLLICRRDCADVVFASLP